MRIRRSAAARQERGRPSRVNRRDALSAWRMIEPKYQTATPVCKQFSMSARSGRYGLGLSAMRFSFLCSLEAECAVRGRSRLSPLVSGYYEQDGDDGGDGEAIVGEGTQAVSGKVLEQKPYREVSHERRGDEARYEE